MGKKLLYIFVTIKKFFSDQIWVYTLLESDPRSVNFSVDAACGLYIPLKRKTHEIFLRKPKFFSKAGTVTAGTERADVGCARRLTKAATAQLMGNIHEASFSTPRTLQMMRC